MVQTPYLRRNPPMINAFRSMQLQLQQLATHLLQAGTVDCVIGYTIDPFQKHAIPAIIHNSTDTQQLVWNDTCVHNLTILLKTLNKEPITPAIIAKGCDVRTIIVLLQEEQIIRENIIIIGMDCAGIKDTAGNVLIKCTNCKDHRPSTYDYLIENPSTSVTELNTKSPVSTPFHTVASLPRNQRLSFWKQQAQKCIRCYACREICPLCYCPECFTDHNLPQYIPATPSLKGNFAWLLLRAFDVAGRCTGCMECDRACPQHIPLHLLNMKLANDITTLFQYEPGESPLTKPLFNLVNDEDTDHEILS